MNQKNKTDQELFREAMQNLQCREPAPLTHEPVDESTINDWTQPSLNVEVTPVQADTTLNFARAGIQKKRIQQLKQGQLKPYITLDLHGNTKQEATTHIQTHIRKALLNRQTCVCIIHGKGMRRAESDYAVLKSHVNTVLQQTPAVLAFHSAPLRLGGQGALLVLLKSLRN